MGRFRLLSSVHPYLFHFGRLIVPTYGFLLAGGTVLSLLVCVRCARLLALDTDRIWTMAVLAVGTLLVTSKALLLLFYWRPYGLRALGMSVYGTRDSSLTYAAVLCASLAGTVYCVTRGLPLLRTGDAVAPSLALGCSIQSIACLEAGCACGTPTRVPWAVIFRSRGAVPGTPVGVPLHPTQLYTSVAAFAVFAALVWFLHSPHQDGEVLGACLFLGGLLNAALAPLRGEPGLWLANTIPVSQLISAGMVALAACLWLRRPRIAQEPAGG